MDKIFVSKISKSKWEKHSRKRIEAGANPDLRWCKLVDSKIHASEGISVGCLRIPVGGQLPLHTHSPQEIYIVKSGSGLLLKECSQTDVVTPSDVIYIPKGVKHGLWNNGEKILEIIWIFPTDNWEEVEYTYVDN